MPPGDTMSVATAPCIGRVLKSSLLQAAASERRIMIVLYFTDSAPPNHKLGCLFYVLLSRSHWLQLDQIISLSVVGDISLAHGTGEMVETVLNSRRTVTAVAVAEL